VLGCNYWASRDQLVILNTFYCLPTDT